MAAIGATLRAALRANGWKRGNASVWHLGSPELSGLSWLAQPMGQPRGQWDVDVGATVPGFGSPTAFERADDAPLVTYMSRLADPHDLAGATRTAASESGWLVAEALRSGSELEDRLRRDVLEALVASATRTLGSITDGEQLARALRDATLGHPVVRKELRTALEER